MTVYVDDYDGRFKNQKWNHMIADSTEELVAMAVKIGLKKEWLQNAGMWHEHFDVSPNMRAKALKEGAVPITAQRAAEIGWERGKAERKGLVKRRLELEKLIQASPNEEAEQKTLYKGPVTVSEEFLKHCVIGDSCSGMKNIEKFKGRRLIVKKKKGDTDA